MSKDSELFTVRCSLFTPGLTAREIQFFRRKIQPAFGKLLIRGAVNEALKNKRCLSGPDFLGATSSFVLAE